MNAQAYIERVAPFMWRITITRRADPDAIATETVYWAWTHTRAFRKACRLVGLPA